MHDRRIHDRRRLLKAGRLVAPGMGGGADCILRDLSAGGARLLVAAPQDLPAETALAVEAGEAPRPVRVVWRGGDAVGVAFCEEVLATPSHGGAIVSLAVVRAARETPGEAERLADRVAAVTRPRSRPLPVWALRP